ncbi:MAG: GSCFA domain-containing protein, partial [bacterium]
MALVKIAADTEGLISMKFEDGGKRQHAGYTWYRGEHCNYNPPLVNLENWQGYRDYFLTGFVPNEPMIGPETQITAFGSCFARNISAWLAKSKYAVLNKQAEYSKSYIVRMGEGLVTSHSILQQMEWAFLNKQPEVELWHGYDASTFGYDPAVREETLRIFSQTDLFVLTFGLSEVWYDKITNEVFWRAVPKDKFDPARHGFRVVGPEENQRNISRIVDLIRQFRPNAKIVVTLSPIPLVATFRPIACTSANWVSKASLRIALDRVVSEERHRGTLFYWPSYEIVMDGFQH